MSLVYVTGVSGTGKSTVLKALQERGFEAYGVDEDGYADWVNRQTGAVEELNESVGDIHKWFEDHAWVMNKDKVAALGSMATGKKVFLCGSAEKWADCNEYFSAIAALHLDDAEEIKRRIRGRENMDFGKAPAEMERIMEWHGNSEKYFTSLGATMIDAAQPVDSLVDQILALKNDTLGSKN